MNSFKKSYFKLIILVLLCTTFFSCINTYCIPNTPNSNLQTKKILILNPSSSSNFHNSLFEAVRSTLDDYSDKYSYIINSICKDPSGERLSALKDLIVEKSIDLIICLDNSSTKIVSDNKNYLCENIPVLYTSVLDDPIPSKDNFAGFNMKYDLSSFIDNILKLHPKTKQVNFLINQTMKDTFFYDKITQYVNTNRSLHNNKIKYNIVLTGVVDKVISNLSGKDTLTITYTTVKISYPGGSTKHASPFGSVENLANATSDPIYGGYKSFGTRFNIGAYNFDGYKLGETVANTSIKVLEGEININSLGNVNLNDEKMLYINSELVKNYSMKPNSDDYLYYNFGEVETIFSAQKINNLTTLATILTICLFLLLLVILHIRKLYKENLKLDSIKSSFIANVSHELRTPLNIIISSLQLFEVYEKNNYFTVNNNKFREKMFYLKKNSSRLLRLVNNIIDISKIEAGYFSIDREFLNIVQVVEDITLSSIDYAEKNGINLIFDTDSEELISFIDKDRIERVVLNLLSNAFKFTKRGGNVSVCIENNSSYAYIKVIDTGIGIPKDQLNVIFERFKQANGNVYRKNEGSGIGLSLCKSMVELHGGTLTVESEVNKGSTFMFNLPLANKSILPKKPYSESNIDSLTSLEYSDFGEF